jgi:hypothetical protein
LTDRPSEVSGLVLDGQNRPIGGATVLVFSSDRDTWYDRSRFLSLTRAQADGRFVITGLPAGEYYALTPAGALAGPDAWRDPEFLESLASGAPNVRLMTNEHIVVNVRRVGR